MDKLKAKIAEKFKTQGEFAKAVGVTDSSVSRLLRGERMWRITTVYKAAEVLGIPDDEIRDYFFASDFAKRRKETA